MNKYVETGTVFRKGDLLNASGNDVTNEVRKAVAEHRRLLQGPHGAMAGKRMTTLGDGTVITTWINPYGLVPTLTARVYCPKGVESVDGYCISISGLFSVANFLAGDIDPLGMTQYYAFLRGDDENNWIAQDFTDSNQFSKHFLTEGSPYRYPDSLVVKKAGLFTGEMKRVVQLLAGQNSEIPYRFDWAMTHGIFINAKTGDKWVIEIESNGVTAWPLEMYAFQCSGGEQALVGDLPVPVTDLDTVTGKIELCDAEYLSDLYDNGGPLLGAYMTWAFSASGHEAQVVIAYPGFGPGNEYTKSFRYKLAFDSDENGDPASVDLTLEQDGYVWTRDVSKNVRAPILTTCGPSHPLALYSAGLSDPPVEGPFSFPVTVFYSGESEQVFTLTHKPIVAEDVYPATPKPTMDPLDCASFIYDPAYIGIDIYSARQTSTGGSIITGIPWAETEIDNSYTVDEYTHTRFELSDSGGAGCCLSGDVASWGVYGSNHKLTKTAIRYPSRTKAYQFCLIFPWFEREAYLFQERWIETQDDPIIEYTSSKRVLGTSWHDSGSNAGITSWRILTEAAWCFGVPAVYKYLGACTETDPTPPVAITDYVPWQSTTFYNLSGPTTTCCSETDQKFVTYSAGSTITYDDTCNVEEELGQAIDTDNDLFRGRINSAGVLRSVDMPSAVGTLFASGISDDLGACSLVNDNPFWFGVWVDAFTSNGWIKHEGYGETDMQYIGQALTRYPMLAEMPISVEFSGWFGTPFPWEMPR